MAATRVRLTAAGIGGVGADLRHLKVANPINSGRSPEHAARVVLRQVLPRPAALHRFPEA